MPDIKNRKSDVKLELNFDIRIEFSVMIMIHRPVIISLLFTLFITMTSGQAEKPASSRIRIFDLNGRQVRVTNVADPNFYGRYQGGKEGYLLLREDGTGEYLYDIAVPAEGCREGVIEFEWGFLVDENEQIVRFERDYGFSYPIIYKCTGENCFQSCRVRYLVDYIMDKKWGTLEVSSSDDWVKEKK